MFSATHSSTTKLFSYVKDTVLLFCQSLRVEITCKHSIIVLMRETLNTIQSQWNILLKFNLSLLSHCCDFPVYVKPKASKVSHLWFLWPNCCVRVWMCVRSACFQWVPGRRHQRVCGILLSWHKRDMRSPRALVIMRECIVAVFKTVVCIRSGHTMNAGLRKLTWIGFSEQCEQHKLGDI